MGYLKKDAENFLKTLGFSPLETQIIIKLLELKRTTGTQVAKEIKAHRRSVYDALERLVKKVL